MPQLLRSLQPRPPLPLISHRRRLTQPPLPATTTPPANLPLSRLHYSSAPLLLARCVVRGSLRHPAVLRQLVESLALSPANLRLSRLLSLHYFHRIPASTTFLYNTLIRCHSKSRAPGESLSVFAAMLRTTTSPDNFTFPFIIKAVSSRTPSSLREGGQVHGQVLKWGFISDTYVVNTLIGMFSAFGDVRSAWKVFDLHPESLDAVSWNSIIDGYVKAGDLGNARMLFDEMPAKNDISWSAMISGYAGCGKLDAAQSLFNRMPSAEKNVVTWNSMVSGFARHGLLPLARKVFDEMPVRNIVSWNAILSGYSVNGEMDLAKEIFDEMPEKDVISWSSMISGYAQSSRSREALELFKKMLIEKRVKPNEVTMASVLSACAHVAALEQGKWCHVYLERNNMRLEDDDNLGAALIDMHAKCGNIVTASEIFWKLDHKNVSAWNAFITGLAINGLAHDSLDVFERMQSSGTQPNDVTFLGLLTACVHGGLVDEGRQLFENMTKLYGIQPGRKHFGCIVDLLGRAGLLAEAEGIMREMPVKADVVMIGALLGACRVHRNTEIADRLRVDFLELKSREAGCHVLLSNIYAAAGRWNDASDMRNIIRTNGIIKEPGSSSVELEGTIYEFVSGDQSYPQIAQIHSWLDEMFLKLRSYGYSPATEDVLLDLSEEDKETCLSRHSEKLATAFAILRAPPHSVIRIVKNLRICGDCHSFIKHVSSVCAHEILVRDRTRFHHFKGGSCSCRDFW